MIFVSVGTHNEQFNRLLEELDRLVESKQIRDKIVAQTGYSTYKPKNYESFNFASWKKIIELNKKAKVVITHGGAGNLLTASHFNKSIVAVPRLKKYEEHVNDHQLQLVTKLDKEKRVVGVYDINFLGSAIKKAKRFKIRKQSDSKEKLIVSTVRSYIEKIVSEN